MCVCVYFFNGANFEALRYLCVTLEFCLQTRRRAANKESGSICRREYGAQRSKMRGSEVEFTCVFRGHQGG